MDNREFVEWLTAHGDLFPDFTPWRQALSDSSRAMIGEEMLKALRDTTLDEAIEVSRGMISGRFEPINKFSYHLAGAHVAKIARALRSPKVFRRTAATAESYRDAKKCPTCEPAADGSDSGYVVVFSGRSVQAVAESAEFRALLLSLIGDNRPERRLVYEDGEDQTRLSAHLAAAARGRKLLKRSDNEAVRAAMSKLHTAEALCTCDSGKTIWQDQGIGGDGDRHDPWRVWKKHQIYSIERHCRCPRGDVLAHAHLLPEWWQEVVAGKLRPNYTDEFDAWNE